jgi:DNA-binding PadR family transcriptional regulator
VTDPGSPPTPLSLAILLALADEPMHGYALMQAVEAQSGGVLQPGTGTLYAALERLLADGLIRDEGKPSGDRRRGRSYAISEEGRVVVRAEIARLQRTVELAKARDLAPEGSP